MSALNGKRGASGGAGAGGFGTGRWARPAHRPRGAARRGWPSAPRRAQACPVVQSRRSRPERDLWAARSSGTAAQTKIPRRFVSRKTNRAGGNASGLVNRPTEAKARAQPAGGARPGRRRRRRIARNVASVSQGKAAGPTRARFGEKAARLGHSDPAEITPVEKWGGVLTVAEAARLFGGCRPEPGSLSAGDHAGVRQDEPLVGHEIFRGATVLDEKPDLVVTRGKTVTPAGKEVAAAVEVRIAQTGGHVGALAAHGGKDVRGGGGPEH